MRKTAIRLALVVAVPCLAGCTPFFYGGIVVLGDPGDDAGTVGVSDTPTADQR